MTGSRPKSKVARVIRDYNLQGMEEQLKAEWTGEYGERTSLRDLAVKFNKAVLEAAIRDSDSSITEADLNSLYRTLTDDDVSSGDRIRKRRELESLGVDIERVESDFVTHQAVHSYLTDYLDVELPDRTGEITEQKAELLERLQGRTLAVANSTVDRLVNSENITDRSYEVIVDVRIVCSDCGSDYAAGELFRQGGCSCGSP